MGLITKGLLILAGILATSTLILWAGMKSAQTQTILAKSNLAIATEANQSLFNSVNRIRAERDLVEKVLSDRMTEQAKIEREAAAAVARKNKELKRLREQYAEVDSFLSMPVPDDFVREWMRRESGHADGND